MISIIDYGAGNLRSVQNTLSEIGAAYRLIDSVDEIRQSEKLVLPGVGHFGQMMRAIDAMRLREPILEYVRGGRPFFGICVGMQGLFESSAEAEGVAGLGIIPGRLQRFGAEARVPHMAGTRFTRRPIHGCWRTSVLDLLSISLIVTTPLWCRKRRRRVNTR